MMTEMGHMYTTKTVFHSAFHAVLIPSIILSAVCLPKCECTITIRPTHAVVIATTSVKFICSGEVDDEINWFKKRTENDDEIIHDGHMGRYDIKDDIQESTLSINSSIFEDSGQFYCASKSSKPSNTAILEIIAPTATWFPSCRQHPERLASGTDVEITCYSSITALDNGVELPDLLWTLDGLIIDNAPFQNATYRSVKYTRTVNRDDHGKQFVCQASLDNLQNPPSCSLTLFVDWSSGNIVPYIIVVVLSIIAILLFAIVIVFVFRFRECKYCKETVPPPQQVLDMSALQDGVGVPMTIVSSSEDEAVELPKSNKKTKLKEQTKTKSKPIVNGNSKLTSRAQKPENFEDNFYQNQASKEYETKTKYIVFNMMEDPIEKHALRGDLKQYKSKNQTEDISAHAVRKHPPTTLAQSRHKSSPKKIHARSKEPIQNINNLGGSSPVLTGSKRSKAGNKPTVGDVVVYADLNFTRNPGLNITKAEYS